MSKVPMMPLCARSVPGEARLRSAHTQQERKSGSTSGYRQRKCHGPNEMGGKLGGLISALRHA